MDGTRKDTSARLRHYWPRVRRFSMLLLGAWFAVTFLAIFYARELSDFDFFGWPVSFYMAAQGLVLFYLAVIGIYVKYMEHLDGTLRDGKHDGE